MYTSGIALLFLLAVQVQAKFFNKTSVAAISKTSTSLAASATAATALDPNAVNCFVTLPNNPLTAQGLSTPFLLQPPCSQTVGTQQAFAEAAIFDPATGSISIYHPLVLDTGKKATVAPVVPVLPAGAVVALWFGFNGGVLQLLDVNGKNTNQSPILALAGCVNGLPGVKNDVFGQVSWCNAQLWFAAANAGIAAGKTVIPDLGVDTLGNACPTSRSFKITDACPSDNVPTQYLLLADGSTIQDTAANRAAHPDATVLNNASDEALLTNIINPLIGCKSFLAPSVDDPGANVPALALSELQASAKQQAPIGLIPLNDPDTLLTANGAVSVLKTNTYRLGVNQPIVSNGANSGALVPYCQNMVAVAPPFLKGYQSVLIKQASPDAGVGNTLFSFLAERYLMSLTQLGCPATAIPVQPVVCQLDGNGAATSCVITLTNGTTSSTKALTSTTKVLSSTKAPSTALGTSTAKGGASNATTVSIQASGSTKASSTLLATSIVKGIASNATTASTKALATSKVLATASSGIKLVTAVANSTKASTASLGTKLISNAMKTSTTALVTSAKLLSTILPTSTKAIATTTKTTTIIIEVITFFIFTLSLGGSPPGVTSNPANIFEFIVLEETFIDLPSAASKACMHQFNACVALAGVAFSGTDCLSQMNICNGVASTASATATTPATLTVAATVPASSSTAQGVSGVVATAAGGGTCLLAQVVTVSSCTAVKTITVIASTSSVFGKPAAPSASVFKRHWQHHLKGRRVGDY